MTERVCETCRWFDENPIIDNDGFCRRKPPTGDGADLPRVEPKDFCGEWSDKSISPEQAERQELTRRFALAIVGTEWGGSLEPIQVWPIARDLARMESAVLPTAEPQIQREVQQ